MKQWIRMTLLLLCVVALLAGACPFFANPLRVVDHANLLTEGQKEALCAKLDALSTSLGQEIAIVTVKTLDGKDVQTYAEDFYFANGYGQGQDRSGILLLVCMGTREYAMTTQGKAVDIFGENDFDSLENAFVDRLSDGDYYGAFTAFADRCEHIIRYEDRLSPVWIFVSLLFGLAVAGLVLWWMASKHKSVKKQKSANSYLLRDTFHLDRSRDVYLYSHLTRVAKPKKSSSGGGSGRSFGGRSGGGRSGRF